MTIQTILFDSSIRSAIGLGLFLFDSSVVVFQDQQKRIIIVSQFIKIIVIVIHAYGYSPAYVYKLTF